MKETLSPRNKRIAEFIAEKRKEKPVETTGELVKIIEAAIPKLRIEVNKELEVLEKVIDDSIKVLKSGGRLGIITFHSLEDRIVKEKFNYYEKDCICPPEFPICNCDKKREVKILSRKPIVPSEEETMHNPRAKSAKLRVLKKLMSGGVINGKYKKSCWS